MLLALAGGYDTCTPSTFVSPTHSTLSHHPPPPPPPLPPSPPPPSPHPPPPPPFSLCSLPDKWTRAIKRKEEQYAMEVGSVKISGLRTNGYSLQPILSLEVEKSQLETFQEKKKERKEEENKDLV